MFFGYLLNPFGPTLLLALLCHCLVCFNDLSTDESRVLSLLLLLCEVQCVFLALVVSFMNVGTHIHKLGAFGA